MQSFVIHKAATRGEANHGWLHSFHTFSFAGYHNPERVHFGALRVLNDDTVAPAMGFGTHPHDNMEIISIPLYGTLAHKDSTGALGTISPGEIQVMSAGTGITHSEFNGSETDEVKFLQIWIFPDKRNVTPRHENYKYPEFKNEFIQIVSPNQEDEGAWIHQKAWLFLNTFERGTSKEYTLRDTSNGVYLLVIDGELIINGKSLATRDAIGIWDVDKISIQAVSETKFLIMEVPKELNQ